MLTVYNREVIMKLLGFTLAMIVCPIGSYFLTVDYVFKGSLLHPVTRGIRRLTCSQATHLMPAVLLPSSPMSC